MQTISPIQPISTEGRSQKENLKAKPDNLASILLTPYPLNKCLSLQNRIVMAPMTRCFAKNHIPTEEMAEYYGKRGGYGLVISEATMIDQDASGYPDTSIMTPPRKIIPISLNTLLSFMCPFRRCINLSWLILSKNFDKSISTTYSFPDCTIF
jgi:hypothetical protein